jgi:hypothetical protein
LANLLAGIASVRPAHGRSSSFKLVRFGATIEGRFMLSNMLVACSNKDHQVKERRVNMTNGRGESWLFMRYE